LSDITKARMAPLVAFVATGAGVPAVVTIKLMIPDMTMRRTGVNMFFLEAGLGLEPRSAPSKDAVLAFERTRHIGPA
jgi:hypothetical protein